MTGILREGMPASLLEAFATATHGAWQWLLDVSTPGGREIGTLPGADPWVRQTRSRIVACVPALGDDLQSLLGQIGLTLAP
jgi:hypothetical protein